MTQSASKRREKRGRLRETGGGGQMWGRPGEEVEKVESEKGRKVKKKMSADEEQRERIKGQPLEL